MKFVLSLYNIKMVVKELVLDYKANKPKIKKFKSEQGPYTKKGFRTCKIVSFYYGKPRKGNQKSAINTSDDLWLLYC